MMISLKSYTTEQLLETKEYLQDRIEANDGRLTVGSSYELDDLLDRLEDIENELSLRESL